MRTTLILSCLLLCCQLISAQVPGVQWQKAFGGSGWDVISKGSGMIQTTTEKVQIALVEGGYMVGGLTESRNGDISGAKGSDDIWIARLDTARNIVWKRNVGGSSSDMLGNIRQTPDRGFILIGSTLSTDGDISGNHGGYDVLVMKLSASGQVEWQRCFGGSNHDYGYSIDIAPDGSYVFAATTNSNDGQVSGFRGVWDQWAGRITAAGNLVWAKSYGGSGWDQGLKVKALPDNSLLIGGEVQSGDGDISGYTGVGEDYRIMKTSATGTIEWQRCFGGAFADHFGTFELLQNGDILVVGTTGGTVPGSGYRGLVARLTANGTTKWQKEYGGASGFLYDAKETPSGDLVLLGYSTSPTGPDIAGNYGEADIWLMRTNAGGDMIWTKNLGGSSPDKAGSLALLSDNEYLVLGQSWSNNYDVSGAHGGYDLWLVKLGPSNFIKGTVYFDANSNGTKDPGEKLVSAAVITSVNGAQSKSLIPIKGAFTIDAEPGTYTTTAVPYNAGYYNVIPSARTSSFSGFYATDSFSFALQPVPGKNDVGVSLIPVTPLRPGFKASYLLLYYNNGTSTASGSLKLTVDSRLAFSQSTLSPATVSAGEYSWNFSNLAPLDTASITITFDAAAPPALNIGTVLASTAVILPAHIDLTPADDTSRLLHPVTNAYDPNDITESHAGVLTLDKIASQEWLQYVIRFQNTGTDTAFNITVRDTLSPYLDLGTIQMLTASHPVELEIAGGDKLAWQFNNILLVDSNRNEPASHGYIVYRVKPKTSLVPGDTIKNSASIYFDFNPPVLTNTEKTAVEARVFPLTLLSFRAEKSGGAHLLRWNTANELNIAHFILERSADGKTFDKLAPVAAGASAYTHTDHQPLARKNYYRLRIVEKDGSSTYSEIRALNHDLPLELTITPNPAQDKLVVALNSDRSRRITYQVVNMEGKAMYSNTWQLSAGANRKSLDIPMLPSGSYILRLVYDGMVTTAKFIKE